MKRISRNFFPRQTLRSIRSFSQFVVLSIMLLVILMTGQFGALKMHAQEEDPEAPEAPEAAALKTDRNVYTEPTLPPIPAVGMKITDQRFGTEILRATDEEDGLHLGTHYPHWPTFNTDNTYILIKKDEGLARIKPFNKTTFTVGAALPDPPYINLGGGELVSASFEGAIWHPTNPRIIYCFPIQARSNGKAMRLYTYDVVDRVYTLVKDFSALSGGNDYLHQMSMGVDGNTFTFAWSHVRDESDNIVFYLVWRASDGLTIHRPVPKVVNHQGNLIPLINEVRLDKKGKWLFTPYNQGDDGTESQVLNVDSCRTMCQFTDLTHDELSGHGDLGTETLAAINNDIYAINWRQLATPKSSLNRFWFETTLGVRDFTENVHISLLAANEDWALVSTYSRTVNPPPAPVDSHIFENEIFQVALDGSHRVRRICHTRSNWINPDYWAIPKANISKDGRFVAFTSNWEVSGGRTDLFIARIDPAPKLTPPRDIRINAGGPRYYPVNGHFWQSDGDDEYTVSGNPATASGLTANNITPDPAYPTDGQVYLTERYGSNADDDPDIPDLSYDIPMPSGINTAIVRLHFAETFFCVGSNSCADIGDGPGVGSRIFDVKLEGVTVLDEYDIIDEANGPKRAKVEQFQVTINDGKLDIDFSATENNAKISAIEVLSYSGSSVWTNEVNATAVGGTLTKIGTSNNWDAGAITTTSIPAGNDGFIEFSSGEANTGKACGLNRIDASDTVGYLDIDFAITLGSGNLVRVYESGAYKGTFGGYTTSDRFRVAVEGGFVKYYRNYAPGAIPFYARQVALNSSHYPLTGDASLQTGTPIKASIADAVISTTPAEDPFWKDVMGVSISAGHTLTKVSTVPGWNAGAVSRQTLSGNGSVEFSTNELATGKMCGLSNRSDNQNYIEIDFAISLGAANAIRIYENGDMVTGNFGSYSPGQRFKVAREGNVIKYYKDGVVMHTRAAPTHTLLVDTSLYTEGATISNVVISGGWSN